jgi:hypothetical protein
MQLGDGRPKLTGHSARELAGDGAREMAGPTGSRLETIALYGSWPKTVESRDGLT